MRFGDESVPSRIWGRLRENRDTGCWEWTGALDRSGYAVVTSIPGGVAPKGNRGHRVMLAEADGHIPPNGEVDHVCRVRHCMNPAHLEWVSHLENMRRALPHKHPGATTTHCARGHERTDANRGSRGECLVCHRERQASRRAVCQRCGLEMRATNLRRHTDARHTNPVKGRKLTGCERFEEAS